MFHCEKCKKVTVSKEKENKVVVSKRAKTYINEGRTTQGWEIEKEIKLCSNCYSNHKE